MNYQKIYNTIISNRQDNPLSTDIYVEEHHIIPSSLNGTDDPENLVKLTAREHFICHALLSRIYVIGTFEWYKMNHAFMMMKCESLNQHRYFNSRLYEYRREIFSKIMSKAQSGKRNSQFGTKWISNIETFESHRINKDIELPAEWSLGRNAWNKTPKSYRWKTGEEKQILLEEKQSKAREKLERRIVLIELKLLGRKHKQEDQERNRKRQAESLYSIFKSGNYKSIRDFANSEHYDKSHVSLTKLWKKYIPDYSDVKQGRPLKSI